jgi:tRNA (guanine-N7-)-methyltransferase
VDNVYAKRWQQMIRLNEFGTAVEFRRLQRANPTATESEIVESMFEEQSQRPLDCPGVPRPVELFVATDRVYPPIRSYKPRRRGLSVTRTEMYERMVGAWSLDLTGPPLDFADVFGRRASVVLDIGFGGGEATIAMAIDDSHRDVVAIEVHTPGIANVLAAIEDHGLTNIRLVDGDVFELLPRIAPGSLDEVRIYFPDPWPKPRQRNRRLVRPSFVAELIDRLAVGGRIHLATDIADYAEQMQTVCNAFTQLDGGVVERPATRPLTRFEQRGLNERRPPTDLIYRRV